MDREKDYDALEIPPGRCVLVAAVNLDGSRR
jgi:hypothetical protein